MLWAVQRIDEKFGRWAAGLAVNPESRALLAKWGHLAVGFGRAYGRDHDRDEAADMAVDVLFRCVLRWDPAVGVPFPAYYALACRRAMVEAKVRQARKPTSLGFEVPGEDRPGLGSPAVSHTDFAAVDAADACEPVLTLLPRRWRQGVELVGRDGCTHKEAAKLLRARARQVKGWCARARQLAGAL